jgi:hypothetical protein
MHPLLRSILAVIAGIVVGSAVNFGIILVNGVLFPLPAGVDRNDYAALREEFAKAPPTAMLLPILAHAGGTLVGAWLAARLAGRAALVHGLVIGVFFLVGGIASVIMLAAPLWFAVIDIALYLPAGWLGAKMAAGNRVGA